MATDIPSQLSVIGSRISPAWLNRLLDAVRRRTLIQGRGVMLTSTPNGTIVSVTHIANGGKGSGSAEMLYPMKVRINDPWLEVYIPPLSIEAIDYNQDGTSTTHLFTGEANITNTKAVRDGVWDENWYVVRGLKNNATAYDRVLCRYAANEGKFTIWCAQGAYTAIDIPIASIQVSDGEIVEAKQIWIGGARFEVVHIPTSSQHIKFADGNDNRTVYQMISNIANMLPSGGGTLGALSNDTPLLSSATGAAGTSTGASRSDHQHPLQVSTEKPKEVYVNGISEGESGGAGSATNYARSDHVHELPNIVGNTDSDADEADMLPDGNGGEGEVGGVASPLGFLGDSPFAAALDHSHPLNISYSATASVTIFKAPPSGASPSDFKKCLGTGSAYARVDHTHVIEGWTWLANDSELGTGAPTGGALKSDTASGAIGVLRFAAPLDHQHPLNTYGTGTTGAASVLKAQSLTGSFGSDDKYSRADHIHPLFSAESKIGGICGYGTGQTVVSPPSFISGISQNDNSLFLGYTTNMPSEVKALYGGDSMVVTEWSRNRDFSDDARKAGVVICVCEKIKYDYTNARFVGFFRNLRFDAAGGLRSVSSPRAYVVAPEY